MNCLECLDLLQCQWDDAALVSSTDVKQHLTQCAACRAMHVGGLALLTGLKNLPPPSVPPDFSRRMTARVVVDRRARRRRARRRFVVTVALAASVLVMAVGGYLLPLPRNHHPEPAATLTPEKQAEAPHLAQAVADARRAVTSLSGRWAERAKEQTKMLLAAAPPMNIPDRAPFPDGTASLGLEPAAVSLKQAGQGVVDGLQPVAKTTQRAVAYLFRELPVFEGKYVP